MIRCIIQIPRGIQKVSLLISFRKSGIEIILQHDANIWIHTLSPGRAREALIAMGIQRVHEKRVS